MALPWWQHHEHCLGYYIIIIIITHRSTDCKETIICPEMLKPWGQNFGLGLGRNPWPRDPLASASSFWSRPRTLIFNFKEPSVLSFQNTSEPPSKKDAQHCLVTIVQRHRIGMPLTNHRNNSPDISSSSTLTVLTQQLNPLHSPNSILTSHYCKPLFQRLFCVPASSAPTERVLSQSGLIMSQSEHTCQMLCSNA